MSSERKNTPEPARVRQILDLLDGHFGTELVCYLNYREPWQLLIAVILSAQCTDARVNLVTPELFRRYPTPEALAAAELPELEELIHSVGFYHNKAANIRACAARLVSDFGGELPSSLEELTSLPGVGRKTANVIRGNIFGEPSVVVDTHVKRIAKRLGFTNETDPYKVEMDLTECLPEDHWILCNLQFIALGRTVCKAPTPSCGDCFLRDVCPSARERS